MTNLSILIKNSFNIFLGKFKGKKQRLSTTASMFLLLLLAGGIVAVWTLQAKSMFDTFVPLGLSKMLLFHALTITLTVVVTIGVMRITLTNKNNDEWLMLSLPIKKRDIIIAKTFNKYLFDLAFVALIFVPFFILYLIYVEFSLAFLVISILLTLFLPLLSVGISYILGFVVSKLFNKFRSAEFLKSLLSVFIFIIVYGLMLMKTTGYGLVELSSMEDFFSDRPITNLFLKMLTDTSLWNVLLVTGLCVVPFIVGMVLYAINYGNHSVGYRAKTTELKFKQNTSLFSSMLKKELNSYATTPSFIANTIIGPVLMLGLSIMMLTIKEGDVLSLLFGLIPNELLAGLVAIVFSVVSGMTVISACTISLEGKNLWILKSTPADERAIFSAKILTQVIIEQPFIIVSSIIATIALDLNVLGFFVVLLVPTFLCLTMSILGLVINLWLPMLEFEDETKVVKQSVAVLITMLGGMLLGVLPYAVYSLFETTVVNMLLITLGIYVLLGVLALAVLFTWGVKRFRKL